MDFSYFIEIIFTISVIVFMIALAIIWPSIFLKEEQQIHRTIQRESRQNHSIDEFTNAKRIPMKVERRWNEKKSLTLMLDYIIMK